VAAAASEAAIAARWRFIPEGDPFETQAALSALALLDT
jgi:hypothetical protein